MKAIKDQPSDAELECNYEFLLSEFNNLWNKTPKELTKFAALKNKATHTTLTFRQKDGIVERCNNVINGTYGNTKAGISFTSPPETKK